MTAKLTKSESLGAFQIELKWDRKVTKESFEDLYKCPPSPQSLFQLHRFIERQYQNLPWPSKLHRIAIMTKVVGGRGDISAAAKVINVMQKMCPSLLFDWVVLTNIYDPQSFLRCSDLSKVKIRTPLLMPEEPIKADFLVVGPVKESWGTNYLEGKFGISLNGPRFDFLENAWPVYTEGVVRITSKMAREGGPQENLNELYQKVHKSLFLTQTKNNAGLVMGLQNGSGVFLDENRLNAPLSRGYCCPSYLFELEDQELQQDILYALGVDKKDTLADYDKHSFNSGYAHWSKSWSKFIDFVAVHEKDKNVTIVLNQVGEFNKLSTEDFSEQVLTKERLAFLKNLGYGTVTLKGKQSLIRQESSEFNERKLTIIIRPSFKPNDMRQLQLASERLLATGDNTAAEAWAARCKLYVYEDVANLGSKREFLQQQIELANTISPLLGNLLRIFGTTHSNLSKKEMDEVIEILNNPSLSQATLQFCKHITENYSFREVLEGALKRVAWHHCIPDLLNEEVDAMDEEFKSAIINFLKDADTPPQVINIKNLPLLAERIKLKVQHYLKNETTDVNS